jgi:hypothetical protein
VLKEVRYTLAVPEHHWLSHYCMYLDSLATGTWRMQDFTPGAPWKLGALDIKYNILRIGGNFELAKAYLDMLKDVPK